MKYPEINQDLISTFLCILVVINYKFINWIYNINNQETQIFTYGQYISK
jgi:hypothetical protein